MEGDDGDSDDGRLKGTETNFALQFVRDFVHVSKIPEIGELAVIVNMIVEKPICVFEDRDVQRIIAELDPAII